MSENTVISCRVDKETYEKLIDFKDQNSHKSISEAVNTLLNIALLEEEEVKKRERVFTKILLKSHFLLRGIIEYRTPDHLKKLDEEYDEKQQEIYDLIVNHGGNDYDA